MTFYGLTLRGYSAKCQQWEETMPHFKIELTETERKHLIQGLTEAFTQELELLSDRDLMTLHYQGKSFLN